MIVADSGARKMHTLDLTAAGHKFFYTTIKLVCLYVSLSKHAIRHLIVYMQIWYLQRISFVPLLSE